MRARTITAAAFTLSLLVGGAGCFKSSTSQASSESSSKSSGSSSTSSSPDDEKREALARDVRDYTASHAGAGGDVVVLQRDIGVLAGEHGILDWEADAGVHAAIGRGLARAGIRGDAARDLGAAIVGTHGERLAWVLAGQEDAGAR